MNEAEEKEYFQYLELKKRRGSPAPQPEDPGAVETIARGATSGATGGWSDEIVGAIETALPWTKTTVGDLSRGEVVNDQKSYSQNRDEQRQLQDKTRAANPLLYGSSEMGGALATEAALAIGTGGASAGVAGGAITGAVAGLGGSEADLTKGEFGRAALDTAAGGALGFAGAKVGQKVGDLVGKGLSKAGNALRQPLSEFAERKALKAAGAIQSTLKDIPIERQQQMGRELLEEGVIGFGAGKGAVGDSAKELRVAQGKRIGDVLEEADLATGGRGVDVRRQVQARRSATEAAEEQSQAARQEWRTQKRQELDDELQQIRAARGMAPVAADPALKSAALLSGKTREKALDVLVSSAEREAFPVLGRPEAPRAVAEGLGFDMGAMLDKVRGEVLPGLSDPALEAQRRQVERLIAGYAKRAEGGVSFTEANKFKSNLQRTINKFTDAPVSSEWKVQTQRVIDDEIERQLGRVRPGALGEFQEAKRLYGTAKETQKWAKQGHNRETGNQTFGLTDKIAAASAGAAALATGNPAAIAGALVLPMANKLARERGAAAVAVGVDQLVKRAAKLNPQALGKFAAPLSAAVARGERSFAVAHRLLADRDPEYRQLLTKVEEEQENESTANR